MTAKCGACDRDMVIIRAARGKCIIACPAGCYRLPAVSTVPGVRQWYDSEAQAVEEACKLYDRMSRRPTMRQGDPRLAEKYRRAFRNSRN